MAHHSQRVWHYLSENARTTSPSNLLFFATSTYPIKVNEHSTRHKLRCWCASACRLEKGKLTREVLETGNSQQAFWQFLYSRSHKRLPLWCFSHGIDFDLITLGFGNELQTDKISLDKTRQQLSGEGKISVVCEKQGLLVLESIPTIIETWHIETGCKVIYVDVQNYYRNTVEELAEMTGIKLHAVKQECEIESEFVCKVVSKCEIIKRSITGLIQTVKEKDLGNFRYTITSQGLQAYRHRFMQHAILIHCNEKALALERHAYFGGDNTIYQYGDVSGPVYVLDVQSFYPSICLESRLPYTLVRHCEQSISPASLRWCYPNWIVAKCIWNHSKQTAPVRYRGKLIKACGRFETTLHLPELARGLDCNAIESISEFALYQQDKIFKKFMEAMYYYRIEARANGNKVQEMLFKLMANSVTGKFGERRPKWIDRQDIEPPEDFDGFGTWKQVDPLTKTLAEFRSVGYKVQRKRMPGENVYPDIESDYESGPALNDETVNSNSVISGAITSLGRSILNVLIDIAGQDNVYYTDTDSIHCNQLGYSNLVQANKVMDNMPGKLCIKGIYDNAAYFGQKFYRLGNDWTVAGVKPDSEVIDSKVWLQNDFSGWSSLVARGPTAAIYETRVKVDRNDEFIPGVILPTGRITPLALNL